MKIFPHPVYLGEMSSSKLMISLSSLFLGKSIQTLLFILKSCPIEVISSGLSVEPEESINPHIRVLLANTTLARIHINSTFGSFGKSLGVFSKKETYLSISDWLDISEINKRLKRIRYTVRVYDARRLVDYVAVSLTTNSLACEVQGYK